MLHNGLVARRISCVVRWKSDWRIQMAGNSWQLGAVPAAGIEKTGPTGRRGSREARLCEVAARAMGW